VSGGVFRVAHLSSSAPVPSDFPEDASPASPYTTSLRPDVRNIAIVAHVDHGKTTLVDKLLRAADSDSADASTERLMDSGELEMERGITITSKVTRVDYARPGSPPTIVNIIDTPGHADFAGEVDRILSSVDGIALVVDASEGPMAQTKYVLGRSLKMGLTPLVVLNKCDRPDCFGRLEGGDVELEVLGLFEGLGATDAQMEYPTAYVSARAGWATLDVEEALALGKGAPGPEVPGMDVLLSALVDHLPAPAVRTYGDGAAAQPLALTATTVGHDRFLGRTVTGRIHAGSVSLGDGISLLRRGEAVAAEAGSVTGIFVNRGIDRTPLDPPSAAAGDIVTITGAPHAIAVGDTLTSTSNPLPEAMETPPPSPATLSMDFGANDGPLAGKEGTIVAASKIRDRLLSETDNNVTLSAVPSATDSERTTVYGRGELQLGILVEQMRREGHELTVAPPRVVVTTCPDTGKQTEPYEEATVDVDGEYAGAAIEILTGPSRRALLIEMSESADGKTRLAFEVPSRGLLGIGPEMATATRGTAVLHHAFLENREWAGSLADTGGRGRLVASEGGKATTYALNSAADRGALFVAPGDDVYGGMVVGENSRAGDLEINVVRAKELTNMRTKNKEERAMLAPPKQMTVEEYIGFMRDDEVIEVTPKSVRLRKTVLNKGERERAARTKRQQARAAAEKNKKK